MAGHSMRMHGAAIAAMLLGGCGGASGATDASATGTEGPPTSSTSSTGSTGSTGEVTPSTGSGATTGTGSSATGDEPTTGEAPVCGDTAAPAEPIAWDPGQPDIAGCEVRGQRDYRAIVHVHSHHSHDACDGNPQPGGVPDEKCLADLRAALCVNRIDVAFTTDHPAHATEATLEEMLLIRGEDEPVPGPGGAPIASWMACANGHRVLVIPGVESSSMMPLGLEMHVPDAYGVSSPASFQQIKDAGALAWVAHTESRDLDELATLGLDGLEFYQLHANLDPDIREEFLGLDPAGFLTDASPFFFGPGPLPAPDLAPLSFLLPNEPSIAALEQLGQTQRLTISAGSDAHQNVLSSKASDGERIDSYRRMLRWFNNRVRVDGPLSPASAKAALKAGNNHIVFEAFGTPLGFDFHARADAAVTEMGAEVELGAGLTLAAALPRLDPRSPQSGEAPGVEGRLYRATAQGRELLHTWTDGPLELAAPGPGVYRVEVWITPRHLAPYLGEVASNYTDKPVPWIYSGAIFVRG